MKIFQKIAILAAALPVMCSCHGDLNVVQKSEFTSLSMWTSESDAVSAVNGVYSQLRATMSTSLPVYGDYRASLYGGGMMSLKDYTNMSLNVLTRDMEGTDWSSLYTTINSANLIIKHSTDITFKREDLRKEVLAHAYFVRAYCYFHIVRIWGDAPLLTQGFESDKQDDLYPTREAAAKIYAQIETDLTEAGNLMPTAITGKHKASQGAINMLKADYYLWKAKRLAGGEAALKAAQTAVNAVLSNSAYALANNFSDIFGNANEENTEIIFSFNYLRNEYVGGYPSYYLAPEQYLEDKTLANNPIPIGSHQQYVSITDDYEAFLKSDATDKRTATSFQVYQDGATRWRWINKFTGEWTSNTRYFSSDIIAYRVAEAILFKAEIENALNNPSGAIAELNRIAGRSYGDAARYSAISGKDKIDDAIIDEIKREFVAESKSWWTMVRFGVAFTRIESLKGKENQKNILLWPVSSSCINTNPAITQTEGYN